MSTAKERIRQHLEELPDDASSEEIRYRIYVREKIAQGEEDVAAGRLLSEEQVRARLSRFDLPPSPQ